MALTIIIVVLSIGVLLLLMRSRGKDSKAQTPRSSRSSAKERGKAQTTAQTPSGPYAAVAIKPGKAACDRVQERGNTRYLKSAAPTLPVLGCDSPNCQCGYEHHDDRRSDPDGDRRMGIGLQSELYASSGNQERRQRRGRRLGDR